MIPSEVSYIHERAKAYQMIEDHEKAVKDFNINIKDSILIGDKLSDIQAGKSAGIKNNFLIKINNLSSITKTLNTK